MTLEPFHHERGIRAGSAGAPRWPRVAEVRATTRAGRLRWRTAAGPFRTRRAAMRAARQQRDANGPRYAWFPGALLYGVTREDGRWWVLTRPARGKPEDNSETRAVSHFDDLLTDVPF